MKDKLKTVLKWRPEPVVYTCGAVAMLILLLIPLLRLAQYAVPWYDDYAYGEFVKSALEQDPTFISAIKGALWCVLTSWHAWQGTYSSIFFMSFMPGLLGEEYYFIGPVFLILFMAISVWSVVYALLRDILKAQRVHACGIAAISSSMAIVLIHTAQEGFYWYNGGIHYVGLHSFFLLMVVLAVKTLVAKKNLSRSLLAAVTTILAFITAGGNFVTTLQGLVVMLSIVAVGFWVYKRKALFLMPALLVYVVGFYINVSATGNDKRADNFVGWGMSPVDSVLNSFVKGAELSWELTGWMTLLFLALMLPLILFMVNRVDFGFRYPGILTLWSVCFYCTGFTPSLYALGHAGLDRTLIAVKMTLQMLLVFNLVYWCGWLVKRKGRSQSPMCRWWYYLIVAGAALVVFHTEPNQAGSFSSYGAYYYIHTGEAYNFYQEYLGRLEILKSDEEQIVFEPYFWRPWFLCMGELSDKPYDEANTSMATWYDKDTIICIDKDEK